MPLNQSKNVPASDVLVKAKECALTRNNQAYDDMTVSVTKNYPQLEKDTWPTQDKEIKAWLADPENAVTPWIDTAAQVRGLSREDYLARTLGKVQQFEQVSAFLTGLRQKYEDQIKAAQTVFELAQLEFRYHLPEE